jgi:hypothetical protein
MNVYTSLTVHDQASALASLPPILLLIGVETVAKALQATGTDGSKKVPTVVTRGAEKGAIHLASGASEPAPNCTANCQENGKARGKEDEGNSGKKGAIRTRLHQPASDCTAEREGFEPSVILRPHRFSRPAHSATLAPLRT